jgi:uncharacterized SAM-binding protein YcdF (DUF218 family)
LRRRAERGAELWLGGRAPLLVPSGGLGEYPPSEAEVIAGIARAHGVPDSALVLEDHAHSTDASADLIRVLAESHGWKRLIVVSEPYHLLRAGWMFRDRGFEVQTACAVGPESRIAIYQALRELGGLAIYAVMRG